MTSTTPIRDRLVQIRVSAAEQQLLERGAALTSALHVSTWLRELGLRVAKRAVEKAGRREH